MSRVQMFTPLFTTYACLFTTYAYMCTAVYNPFAAIELKLVQMSLSECIVQVEVEMGIEDEESHRAKIRRLLGEEAEEENQQEGEEEELQEEENQETGNVVYHNETDTEPEEE